MQLSYSQGISVPFQMSFAPYLISLQLLVQTHFQKYAVPIFAGETRGRLGEGRDTLGVEHQAHVLLKQHLAGRGMRQGFLIATNM